MEEREEGMTFGEIISLLFKRKLLVLIITLVVGLIGTLAILLIYNRSKNQTTVNYYYVDTVINSGDYSNGEKFRNEDLISLETINEVIKSKEKYKGLDAEKIHDNVKIQKVTLAEADGKTDSTKILTNEYYQLTIPAKLVDNKEIAKAFFMDLVSYPINKNETIITEINYKQILDRFAEAKTYDEKFTYLDSAIADLEKRYNNIITTYGDVLYTDSKGVSKLLSERLKDIQLTIEEKNLGVYKTSTADYGLVLSYEYTKPLLQNQLNNLNEQVKLVNNKYTAIKEQYDKIIEMYKDPENKTTVWSLETQDLIAQMNNLNLQKIELNYQIEKIGLKYENETATNVYYGDAGVISERVYNELETPEEKANYYSLNISAYKTRMENVLTGTYDYVSSELDTVKEIDLFYNDVDRSVYYVDQEVMTVKGGLSTIIAIVLSLVIGLVVGCIVSFALSYGDFKVKKEKELEEKEKIRIQKQIAYQKMLKDAKIDVKEE